MAGFIPSDIGRLELAGGLEPELEALRYLRGALPAGPELHFPAH
jgi:hypothetical protein